MSPVTAHDACFWQTALAGIDCVDGVHCQWVQVLHAGPSICSLPADVEGIRLVQYIIHDAMCCDGVGIDCGRHTLPTLRSHT